MLAIERRNLILEKLQAEKKVLVSDLSQLYDVTEETIRRDLEKLEKSGLVTKSYGGAVLNENTNLDLPFNVRKNRNVVAKQKIAGLMKDLVQDGDTIMLDSSSTAVFIAKALKEKQNLTVITNSIEILIELLDVQGWRILSTGGALREGSLDLVGPQSDRMISSYYAEKAIVSCKGIDLAKGITDSNEQLAGNKRAMLEASRKKILVVDSSKFGMIAFTKISDVKEFDAVVTDKEPDGQWKQYFEENGVECLYLDERQGGLQVS